MIVPMRKVTVVCLAHERSQALLRLRDLGVLHVAPAAVPAGGDLEAARKALERTRSALAALAAPAAPGAPPPTAGDADAVVERVHALLAERRDLEQQLGQLRAERSAQAGFGDFDPAQARALAEHGVRLRLYEFPAKGTPPAPPLGASLHVLGSAEGTTCAALVGPPDARLAAREVALPARSLGAIDQARAAQEARRAAIERELAALTAARRAVGALVTEREDEVQLLEAKTAMAASEGLAWITGFCPEPAVADLLAAAERAGWAVTVRNPAADDVVPTKLAARPWVRQVHAVLEMIGITPGYGEPDVSPVFLVFLVLFAAMLIGDAGYGALLLAAAFLVRRKWPHTPVQPIRLLRTVGLATMAWGAITGTWFAIPDLPAPLAALRIDWLTGSDSARHVMLLCFLLGAIHLTVAHLWAALRAGLGLAALAQLGWIASTWCMFAIARTMVLGAPFPAFMVPVAIAGAVAIVLFMTPLRQLKTEWFNHVMLPLSVVSSFVDVVSYLRLFAVGTAGVAVATAFNDMAARIGAGGGPSLLLAALVAFFGHTLNLLLCAMGVLVHGVRLNTLEFSAHLGMQWSGVPYRPLQRRTLPVRADEHGNEVEANGRN